MPGPLRFDHTFDTAPYARPLAEAGYAVLAPDEAAPLHELVERGDAWRASEAIAGRRTRMLEQQPVRPVAGGRSFASTQGPTPLHSDSQRFRGAPPDLQVMLCHRAADDGGASTLLDTWPLFDALAARDLAFLDELLRVPLLHPFVFGALAGPVLALRGGALACTHSPTPPRHPVAQRFRALLDATPSTRARVATGGALLLDNRRVLHGRDGFTDPRRFFTRLLVWLDAPLGRHAALEARARAALDPRALAALPTEAQRRAGHEPAAPDDERATQRLDAVLAMLRGVAPGALATRLGLPEGLLYAWRDEALGAARDALARCAVTADAPDEPAQAALRALR